MPIARIKLPDGRIARFEVPDAQVPATELLRTTNPVAQSIEAGLIGAGRTFERAGQGIRRIAGQDVSGEVEEGNRLIEPLKRDFPVSTFVGEAAPTLPIGGATLKGTMAAGAAIGGLQPEGNPLMNAALGATVAGATKGALDTTLGLAGARLPSDKLARRMVKKNAGKTLSQRAKEQGIKLSPAEEGGGFGAQIAEDATRTNAFTADLFQARAEDNLAAINRNILKRFGEKGEVITGEALERINNRISQQFDDVISTMKNFDTPQAVSQQLDEVASRLEVAELPGTTALFDRIQDLLTNPGIVSKTDLSRTINLSNQFLGQARAGGKIIDAEIIQDATEVLFDSLESSVKSGAKAALRSARRNYRDFSVISGRNVVVDGDIQLGALRNSLLGKYTSKAFTRGDEADNAVFEVARLFEQLERKSTFVGRNGGSQTAGRQLMQSAASLPVAGPLALGQSMPPQVQAIIGQLGGRIGNAAARAAAIKATENGVQ